MVMTKDEAIDALVNSKMVYGVVPYSNGVGYDVVSGIADGFHKKYWSSRGGSCLCYVDIFTGLGKTGSVQVIADDVFIGERAAYDEAIRRTEKKLENELDGIKESFDIVLGFLKPVRSRLIEEEMCDDNILD